MALARASIALSWPNTRRLRSLSMLASTSASDLVMVLGGMRAMVATVASTSFTRDLLLALALRHQHLRGARLVDHVDRLVGQLAVVDVLGRQLHRRLDRLVGVLELVVLLEVRLQALEDLDGVLDRRLLDVDLLEAAHQRAVLLEVLAVLLVGGRADAAHACPTAAPASAGWRRPWRRRRWRRRRSRCGSRR